MNTYQKFTYANPWMLDTWVHTKILKKFNEKQNFHHQVTKVNYYDTQ